MDFAELLSQSRDLAPLEESTKPSLEREALHRILWAAWKTPSLRGVQPWRCIVLTESSPAFWSDFATFLSSAFIDSPATYYYTKFYGPQFDHACFAARALGTIAMCVDWDSYVQEFGNVPGFVPGVEHVSLAMEAGRCIQNVVLGIRNEGFSERVLDLDCQIPAINNHVTQYLGVPPGYRVLALIPFGLPGGTTEINNRPLKTFIHEERWRSSSHQMRECPRAAQCKRFRFIFPKYCSVCVELISSHHYHDVPNSKIYCDTCARDHLRDRQTQPEASAAKQRLPRLCEYQLDCDDYSLFDPKICSECGGVMDAHWHNTDTERKYCAICTLRLFHAGTL